MAVGVGAAAHAPPAPAQAAPTRWQTYPTDTPPPALTTVPSAVSSTPPASAPPLVPPPAPVPSSGPIGSRVVVFTKPAGDVTPVQATARQPAGQGATPPAVPPPQPADGLYVPTREPDRARVFRLPTDEEVFAEPVPGTKTSMADLLREIQADNDKRLKEYQEAMNKFNRDPNRNEKDRPKPPQLLRAVDLTVSTAGLALGTPPPTKPAFSPTRVLLEPGYVVHRRLYFEEKNSERYGWDLGAFQPVLSTASFFKDSLFWPSHLASNLHERYDTSAGKCLPGSPVPYLLYPPQITVRGGVVGVATIIGVVFLLAP